MKGALIGGAGNLDKTQEKFIKRKNELKDFVSIVEKIKVYIKTNRASLLKKKGEDEMKIN